MSRLFALADLHLSGSGKKPMDVFGPVWENHTIRMADAWDRVVTETDLVLVPGDISWARSDAEVAPDLDWLRRRPGRKLLLRGNHDGWWGSRAKVENLLPSGCTILHNDAHEWQEWVLIGARGWTDPDDPIALKSDARIFGRELARLDASIADADRKFDRDRPRLAMLHYPCWLNGRRPTTVVDRLRAAAVRHCVYGHLHGDDHRWARRGIHDGIDFHFVAADAVDFQPVLILEAS